MIAPTTTPNRVCAGCGEPLPPMNRKYCCDACRRFAYDSEQWNPSPEEIREMCRQIREEGGEEWERARSCFPVDPVEVRTVRMSSWDVSTSRSGG